VRLDGAGPCLNISVGPRCRRTFISLSEQLRAGGCRWPPSAGVGGRMPWRRVANSFKTSRHALINTTNNAGAGTRVRAVAGRTATRGTAWRRRACRTAAAHGVRANYTFNTWRFFCQATGSNSPVACALSKAGIICRPPCAAISQHLRSYTCCAPRPESRLTGFGGRVPNSTRVRRRSHGCCPRATNLVRRAGDCSISATGARRLRRLGTTATPHDA